MASTEDRTDEILRKIVLDIKAFVLLQGSEAELRTQLQRSLVDSRDESVRKFVEAVQAGRTAKTGQVVVVALGELLLASLLVLAGTITLVPNLVGINTPNGLIVYFAETAYGTLSGTILSGYVSLIEFGVGTILMLSAFYTLRQAALTLKEMGLSIKSGES